MFSEFPWAVELGEKGCFAGPALAHHEEGAPVGRAGQVAGRLLQLGRPPQEHTGGPAAQVGVVEDLGGGAALRRAWETGPFVALLGHQAINCLYANLIYKGKFGVPGNFNKISKELIAVNY